MNTPALVVLIGFGVLAAGSSLYGLSRARKRRGAHRRWELRRLRDVLLEVAVSREAAAVEFRQHLPRVRQACADFDVLMGRDDYFRNSAYECWKKSSSQIANVEVLRIAQLGLAQHEARDVARLRALLAEGRSQIDERNSEYVKSLKEKHAKVLSALSAAPLSDQQQDAVLNDEDRTLVIAGAGTGKTTTLKAKIHWLLQMGLAKPEELLVLSFARDVASELSAGLADHGISVKTLHSYGRSLLTSAGHRKLLVSKMAEDNAALIRFIDDKLQEMLRDPTENHLFNFLMNDLAPARLWVECASKKEYWDYIDTHEPRALKGGRRLRSYEEVRIANFLFAQGIEYEYERKYEVDTTAPGRQQYRPDFYLLDYGIYIEHFGIDRQGNPGFLQGRDAENYKDDMSWKRLLHSRHKTRLVESYSWEAQAGVLEDNLAEKLRELGVEFCPRSRQQMLASFNRDGRVRKLSRILASVLNLFKEGDQSLDELASRAAEDSQRAQVIVQVFGQILDVYEGELARTECVDFHDMINRARNLLEDTRLSLRLSYILVDELQDISPAKAQFLISILKTCPGVRLFCVGDDWQSIYRFTGSDVTVMTDFGALFGFHREVVLNRTYRFGEHVEAVSSVFVQKNHAQISKRLVPHKPGHMPAVHVMVDGTSSIEPGVSARPALERALQDIAKRVSKVKPRDVLVLGRYNHTWDRKKEIVNRIYRDAPNLSIRFLTVHKSKGMEADYVIVAGMNNGKYGFPCEITDDPVLDLVISHAEQYENAEERRLFYVALTRTKRDVYLLTTDGELSDFIIELSGKEYAVNFIDKPNQMKLERCSKCGIGRLEVYEGRFGNYRECRLCGYKPGKLRRQ